MSTKKAPVRQSKNFCLTTYYTLEDALKICDLLQREGWLQHYAMQLHDKDVNEDGTPKEPHVHIVVITYRKTTCNKVRAMFYGQTPDGKDKVNTLAQVCENLDGAYDYLTHRTPSARADGKYQYSLEDTKTDFDPFWCERGLESREVDSLTSACFDLANGCVTHTQLLKRYGRDFIINYRNLREVAYMLKSEYDSENPYERITNTNGKNTTLDKFTGEIVED